MVEVKTQLESLLASDTLPIFHKGFCLSLHYLNQYESLLADYQACEFTSHSGQVQPSFKSGPMTKLAAHCLVLIFQVQLLAVRLLALFFKRSNP